MRRLTVGVLVIAVVLSALIGWWIYRDRDAQAAPENRTAGQGPTYPRATARTRPTRQPILSMSANGEASTTVHRGWPLLLSGVIVHAQAWQPGTHPPIVVTGAGRWMDAVRIEATSAGGAATPLPLATPQNVPAEVRVTTTAPARFMFMLAEDAVAQLADGEYQLVAVLPAADGRAEMRSRPVSVRVDKTTDGPADRADARDLLRAAIAHLRGDGDATTRIVDGILQRSPTHAGALELRGDRLRAQGQLRPAVDAYAAAITSIMGRRPPPAEPPVHVLRKHGETLSQLARQPEVR